MGQKVIISIILIMNVLYSQEYGWLDRKIIEHSELNSAFFLNENLGWVAGGAGLGDPGVILITTDGGGSWIKSEIDPIPYLYSIFFIDSLVGWACGYNGVILKTTTAGLTWTIDTLSTESNECFLKSCFFINSDVGFISGWEFYENGSIYDPIILKTIDGGNNWARINLPNVKGRLFDCYFIDEKKGFAIGGKQEDDFSGLLLKTLDGGNSWSDAAVGNISCLYEMNFINDTLAYFIGEDIENSISRVLVTFDGGINISELYSKKSLFVSSLYFRNKLQGWICGSEILSTTNGGINWEIEEKSSGKQYKTMQFKNNKGWAFGYEWASGDGYSALYTDLTDINLENKNIPTEHLLYQNFPNPFNASTEIVFHLQSYSNINLSVFNVEGQKIIELINGPINSGKHQVVFDGSYLSSGIYYYRICAGRKSITKKMLLVK